MYKQFEVRNYRGFSHFVLEDLARVNLLVGMNNSGKTGLLEAVALLASGGDLSRLWSFQSLRGEWSTHYAGPRTTGGTKVHYLFYGYRATPGSSLRLAARLEDDRETTLDLMVDEPPESLPPPLGRPILEVADAR